MPQRGIATIFPTMHSFKSEILLFKYCRTFETETMTGSQIRTIQGNSFQPYYGGRSVNNEIYNNFFFCFLLHLIVQAFG